MHENHRNRLKTRFLKNGFQGESVHNLLESLLFYSIPRADTNPIAHRLLERFGSIKGVFDASFNDLEGVEGVGPQTAFLIKNTAALMRQYALEADGNEKIFKSISTIAQYFCRLFIGKSHECLYMMLLNNRNGLIDCVLVSEGTVNSSAVNLRGIVEQALYKNASAIVLAHNHPNGHLKPSAEDIGMTENLDLSLRALDIALLDHLVIVHDRFHPIMQHYNRIFKPSSIFQDVKDDTFFDRFYDVDPDQWKAKPFFQ